MGTFTWLNHMKSEPINHMIDDWCKTEPSIFLHLYFFVYLGFSLVVFATVVKVNLTLIDQEGVVSGHLIGQTTPSWFMNIHEGTGGGVGAFVNAAFHSTCAEWCVL